MRLETARLFLRPFTEADFEDFAALVADPDVMKFSLAGPLSHGQAKEMLQTRIIDHYNANGFGLLALHLKDRGVFVGFAGLIRQTIDGQDEVELGYRLMPQFWGQGLASEAAEAILRFGFGHLKVAHIISIIDPGNVRSVRVAERAGMSLWKNTRYHGIAVSIYRRDGSVPGNR